MALRNNTTLTELSFRNSYCPSGDPFVALASTIAEANILQSLSLRVIIPISYLFSNCDSPGLTPFISDAMGIR